MWKKAVIGRALFGFLLFLGAPSLADTPPPLDAYGDLPDVEDMALSPDGKGVAMVGRIKGARQIVVFEGPKLRAMTALGEAKLRSVQWAGPDRVIATISSTERLGPGFTVDKMELYGTVILPLDGSGRPEMIFAKAQSINNATFGHFGTRLVDGKWMGYFGGIELKRSTGSHTQYEFDHGRPALFGVDLATNFARKAAPAPSDGHWRDWLVDESGRIAAVLDVTSATGRWEITNVRGQTLASGIDKTGDVALISFGHGGATLVYSVEDDANQAPHWFEIPLAGGTPTEILTDVGVKRLYIDRTNGQMMGYLPNGTAPQPVLFDSARQAIMRKVFRAFPKRDLTIIDWTANLSHILVRTSGNNDSGTWFLVDMARMAADPVGDERTKIDPAQVGPISTVTYTAADGLGMDGILTLPPGREAKNLPALILPHGGPHTYDSPAFDWWAQAFASRGYAVFQPNFRGSTNRSAAFRRAGYGQWGRKMQTDLSDGLTELVKQGTVDPKRVCIMGASYGGYAALAGVTLQQGIYRCAVAVAPVSDLKDMYYTDSRESGGNSMVRASLRESLGDLHTFDAVSPRRNAAKADAPILLIHGKDDTVVPFKQGDAMADALRRAGKPHELVVLREEDHWLSRPATRKQMLEAAMAFVQKNNPAE